MNGLGKVRFEDVVKMHGSFAALKGVDFEIEPGEFFALLGPSGSGKSTTLRILAGLDMPTRGRVVLDDQDVTAQDARERDVAMVFQSYALYPHMTVAQNIAFPLEMEKKSKAEIEPLVREAARKVRIDHLLDRRPGQLSGGQRQRVAIGRAIVREPAAFLFDEPLSNLDAALRVGMRLEISELHQRLKTTMVYVTHDQVEAMTMADKIVVLRAGKVEQVGSPLDLYTAPQNTFVAGFIGSPKMNLVTGAEAQRYGVETIGIRPEHVTLSTTEGAWTGTVKVAEHLGSDTFLHVESPIHHEPLTVRAGGEFPVHHGDTVYLTPQEDKLHRFDGQGLAIR